MGQRGSILSVILVLFMSISAKAVEVDASGLPETKKLEIQMQIEKLKAEEAASKTNKTEEKKLKEKEKAEKEEQEKISTAVKYSEIGKQIGVAIGETAKSLNVAVNDFVETPVGKATFFILAWKIAGHDIMRYGVGNFIIFCFSILWIYFYRKNYICKPISEVKYGAGWWIFRAKEIKYEYSNRSNSNDVSGTDIITVLCLVIFILFSLFNNIAS